MVYSCCSILNHDLISLSYTHRAVEMLRDRRECSLPEEIPCYLLNQGNYEYESGFKYAKEFHRYFVQIMIVIYFYLMHLTHLYFYSAKTRDGVQEAFEELVHKILQTPGLYTTDSSQTSQGFGLTSSNSSSSQTTEGCWCTL